MSIKEILISINNYTFLFSSKFSQFNMLLPDSDTSYFFKYSVLFRIVE